MMRSEKQMPQHVKILLQEYAARKNKNSSYSIRAFAKSLGIDSGTLSAVFKNKRALSYGQGIKICDKLSLSTVERERFLKNLKGQTQLKKLLSAQPNELRNFILETPEHQLLLHWENYAILSLIDTVDFLSDPQWIADRLGLGTEKVREALLLLKKAGMISIQENGEIKKLFIEDYFFSNPSLEQSRIAAHETLQLISRALQSPDLTRSLMFSVTMPVDPMKLQEVHELIIEFEMRLAALLKGERPSQVYRMALGLIPLTV